MQAGRMRCEYAQLLSGRAVNDPADPVNQQDKRDQDEDNLDAKQRTKDRGKRDDHRDNPDDDEDCSHPARHTCRCTHSFH